MGLNDLFSSLFQSSGPGHIKLPPDITIRIIKALEKIIDCPFMHIQKMKGDHAPPQYKFRVGEYRVILILDKSDNVLLVDALGHRSTIYQRYGKG